MKDIFNVKKIKSPYTNIEYELETFDKSTNEDIMTIISHNSLERLMHNVLMNSDYSVNYDLNFIECTKRHTVVECVIWDKNSRRISGIGESSLESLNSSIAKQYPSLTASQRAFDRAIIRYLGFEGRCYSDSEFSNNVIFENFPETINIDENKNSSSEQDISEKEIQEEISIEDVIETEATAVVSDKISEQEIQSEIKEIEDVNNDRFNVIVNIGRYKGENKTIPEIYNGSEEDKKWFEWAVTSYSGKTAKDTINLMKEYKKMKEEF